jgi:uncharacterized membrane protein YphA (DoxX/SURF4 family)
MMASHNKSVGLLLLRVATGLVFLVHGYLKIVMMSDPQGTIAFFASIGLPAFCAYLVAYVELLGGISLIVGYGSKIFSALLAIVMIVALIKVHIPMGWLASELPITLLGATLGIFFAGAGKYGLGSDCGCPVGKGTCPVDKMAA